MQRNSFQNIVMAAAAFAAVLMARPVAHAHIDMAGALMSRGGDQKNFPCDGKRGDGPTYTFEPGAIITLSVNETIPHPSYFRIAFDNDGDDAFVEPKSIKPIDPARPCPFDANDKCGEPDYCNVKSADGGPTVLLDNLDPHMGGGLKTYKWTVKLPNVECTNCTIQVLQIMEDTVHGAYCPTGSCMDSSLEDIYHRCIDITLKKGAMNSPGIATSEMMNNGMQCVQFGTDMPAAGSGASGAGGMSGSPATAGASATAGSTAGGAAGMMGTAGTGAAGSSSGAAGAAVPPSKPMSSGSAGMPSTGMAPASGASGSTGTMQNANSIAGSTAPATAGTAAAPMTAPPPSDSGCSVHRSGNTSSQAGWLLAIAALALFRRRRAARR